MIFKDGVNLSGLKYVMRQKLIACEEFFKKIGKEFCITEVNTGLHSAGSLHYYGIAFDVRTRHLTNEEVHELFLYIQNGPTFFDIVIEKDHIHIEADRRKAIRQMPIDEFIGFGFI